MRWRLDALTVLKRVPLDELTALFDRRSGMTHILGSPLPELIDALVEGEADEETLLDRLGMADAVDTDRADLRARLQELVEAGLVIAR